uniref:IS1 family transposase n=18 Tax=Enterobacteriaceae TaxID=543 RepID=A0A2S1PQ06_ECOLX|nr:IS1 family transposase [Escherichia coli]
MYDGVFEVLQWLLFLSAVPPVQLLTGWCVTAKAPPDISAISALTAVKHGNCSSLTPLLNPVRTRKSLIWPLMALDAGQLPALWALASTRFYVT